MKTAIIGATGYIGRALVNSLTSDGLEVVAVTRSRGKAIRLFSGKVSEFTWDGKDPGQLVPLINDVDVVVNLAGENLSAGRWTKSRREKIYKSRIGVTKSLSEAIKRSSKKPGLVVQGSAIGIYGTDYDQMKNEPEPGRSFLSQICLDWEAAIQEVAELGIPLVISRTGVVLGKEEGMLPKVELPMKLFVGGHPGTGTQFISWIHHVDMIRTLRYLMEKKEAGTYNVTAPGPLTQKNFFKILGKVLKRPSWIPVPAFLLRMIFGQMADETVLASQRALPDKLLEMGFGFDFPDLESALRNIYAK